MSNPAGHLKSVRVLYKTILRLHRGLPEELQSLGHQYVRDEFKRHKTCNPAEAAVFMQEWRVCMGFILLFTLQVITVVISHIMIPLIRELQSDF